MYTEVFDYGEKSTGERVSKESVAAFEKRIRALEAAIAPHAEAEAAAAAKKKKLQRKGPPPPTKDSDDEDNDDDKNAIVVVADPKTTPLPSKKRERQEEIVEVVEEGWNPSVDARETTEFVGKAVGLIAEFCSYAEHLPPFADSEKARLRLWDVRTACSGFGSVYLSLSLLLYTSHWHTHNSHCQWHSASMPR